MNQEMTKARPQAHKPLFDRMALIGAGVTGQAFGKAVVKLSLIQNGIAAYDIELAMAQAAVAEKAADTYVDALPDALKGADLVVLATPITATKEILNDILSAVEPGAIVTDFGRTKTAIVAIAEEHPRVRSKEVHFIGGDPLITRRALLSYKNAVDLFETIACFLCKTENVDAVPFARLVEFWQCLGTQVVVARPHRHDKLVSWTEQLQLIAIAATLKTLEDSGEDQNLIRGIAGTVLRDSTTHIKDINIEQFDDVMNANRDNLREGLRKLRKSIEAFEAELDDPERLHTLLNSATLFRKHLDVHTIEKPVETCPEPNESK